MTDAPTAEATRKEIEQLRVLLEECLWYVADYEAEHSSNVALDLYCRARDALAATLEIAHD